MRRILVPTDFSDAAAAALRYASVIAERSGASLVVMHADAFIPAIDFTGIPAGEFDLAQRRLVEIARLRLNAHAQENINLLVPWDAMIAINDPVNAIVNASKSEYDLIVMGTHGRTGVNRMIFGSVTASVMRLAATPVLAVHGNAPDQIRRIACPVSITYPGREALRLAAQLSPAPIVVLRTNSEDPVRLQKWLPEEIADRTTIALIPPRAGAEDIVSFAKLHDVDLIALDVPSDRRVIDIIEGTIAEKIVRTSDCPVLTVNALAAESIAVAEAAKALA